MRIRDVLGICIAVLDKRARRTAIVFAAGSALLGVFDLVGVLAIGLLIQRALLGEGAASSAAPDVVSGASLVVLGFGGGAVLVAKSVLSIVLTRLIGGWAARQEYRASDQLFNRLLTSPLGRMERLGVHAAARGVILGGRLVGQALAAFLALIGDVAVLVMLVLLLFVADPLVASASMVFFGSVLGLGARWSARRISVTAQAAAEAEKGVTAEIDFAVALGRDVRLRTLDGYLRGRFAQHAERYAISYARQFELFQFPRFYLEVSMVLGLAIVSVLAISVAGPERGMGLIGLFLVAATRLVPALVRLQGSISFLNMSAGWIPLRREVVDLGDVSPTEPGTAADPAGEDSTIFVARDVHLGYGDEGGDALCGVDLRLASGDRVAFVGASGSGKSTMLDVVSGLRSPGDGSHRGSGVIVRRSAVTAYVPQAVAVFSGTIAENIAMTSADAIDGDRLWQALRDAQLADHVGALPEGVDSPVLGAFGLSGGQRQRLGLARALYTGADLLILDEPTSALDNSTESRVMDAVLALPRSVSVVVAAHRLNSIRAVDRVYLFDRGKVVDSGSYAEVIGRNSAFFSGLSTVS
jgi:ABC-type multidrug transport system fused ATPase/permease subunit